MIQCLDEEVSNPSTISGSVGRDGTRIDILRIRAIYMDVYYMRYTHCRCILTKHLITRQRCGKLAREETSQTNALYIQADAMPDESNFAINPWDGN